MLVKKEKDTTSGNQCTKVMSWVFLPNLPAEKGYCPGKKLRQSMVLFLHFFYFLMPEDELL